MDVHVKERIVDVFSTIVPVVLGFIITVVISYSSSYITRLHTSLMILVNVMLY
jgi:hypothetical protein